MLSITRRPAQHQFAVRETSHVNLDDVGRAALPAVRGWKRAGGSGDMHRGSQESVTVKVEVYINA